MSPHFGAEKRVQLNSARSRKLLQLIYVDGSEILHQLNGGSPIFARV